MEIKIDYFLHNTFTGRLCGLQHLTLTEDDIIEFAIQKYSETGTPDENIDIIARIDTIITG